jgi:cytochrome c-type biogenesis protein CcmH
LDPKLRLLRTEVDVRRYVFLLIYTFLGAGLFGATLAQAAIDAYHFSTPAEEQRFTALIEELRCPKCQNQNLAGSNAPIAKDLKDRIYTLMEQGKSDDEIRAYLVDRYGDFISYKPPLRASTLLLWAGPFTLLIVAAGVLVWRVRRPPAPPQAITAEERARLQAILDETERKA